MEILYGMEIVCIIALIKRVQVVVLMPGVHNVQVQI